MANVNIVLDEAKREATVTIRVQVPAVLSLEDPRLLGKLLGGPLQHTAIVHSLLAGMSDQDVDELVVDMKVNRPVVERVHGHPPHGHPPHKSKWAPPLRGHD